jgi:hypothetical protein
MTDEHMGADSASASPESAEADDDPVKAVSGKSWESLNPAEKEAFRFLSSAAEIASVATVSIYAKAFLETLAKRHADAVADLVRTRVRRRDRPDEYRIGTDDGSAATIVITEYTPDEARLAQLDLDITSDELRGKLLRWDSSTSEWRAN